VTIPNEHEHNASPAITDMDTTASPAPHAAGNAREVSVSSRADIDFFSLPRELRDLVGTIASTATTARHTNIF
jgi:hypothetical protein